MIRSLRFLLQFAWVHLATVLGFAGVVTAGALLTGVPAGKSNLFQSYFASLPLISIIMLFVFAASLCTTTLNLSLSLGGRRRDFFLALQGILVLYTGVCWALQVTVAAIPILFQWSDLERWSLLTALRGYSPWSYPLLCLAVICLGCVCGLVFLRSRVLGVLLSCAAGVLGLFGIIFLLTTSDVWGVARLGILSLVMTVGALAVIGGSEVFLWYNIRRCAVK